MRNAQASYNAKDREDVVWCIIGLNFRSADLVVTGVVGY